MNTRKIILTAGITVAALGTAGTAAYASTSSPAAAARPAAKTVPPVTAGPAGLDVTFRSVSVPDGNQAALAVCPADHPYVTGGGGQANDSGATLTISAPVGLGGSGPGAWVASGSNGGAATATVLCSK